MFVYFVFHLLFLLVGGGEIEPIKCLTKRPIEMHFDKSQRKKLPSSILAQDEIENAGATRKRTLAPDRPAANLTSLLCVDRGRSREGKSLEKSLRQRTLGRSSLIEAKNHTRKRKLDRLDFSRRWQAIALSKVSALRSQEKIQQDPQVLNLVNTLHGVCLDRGRHEDGGAESASESEGDNDILAENLVASQKAVVGQRLRRFREALKKYEELESALSYLELRSCTSELSADVPTFLELHRLVSERASVDDLNLAN